MAVSFHAGGSATSASSVTVGWTVPGNITAGDIWICSASLRGGSTVTISNVPAGFTLIARVDAGAVVTNETLVVYWYKAIGNETGTFATITLSATSKSATVTDAFSGVNTTTPIVSGSVVTNSAITGSGAAVNIPAFNAGQADYCVEGFQGESASHPLTLVGGTSPAPTTTESPFTSGGAGATNVGMGAGYTTTNTFVGTPSWSINGSTGDTYGTVAFTLDVAATAAFVGRPIDVNNETAQPQLGRVGHVRTSSTLTPFAKPPNSAIAVNAVRTSG
jgi:hypothetical protein